MKNLKMTILLILIGISALAVVKYANDSLHYGQNFNSSLNLTKDNNNSKVVDSCKNLTGTEKAKCYFDEGNLNMSLKVCENLSNKNECIGRIGLEYAKINIDGGLEICGKLPGDSDERLVCYTAIAGIAADKYANTNVTEMVEKVRSICVNTSQQEICGSNAARVLAYKNADKAAYICTVEMAGFSKACYISVVEVVAKYNVSKAIMLCDQSSVSSVKYACYNSVAGIVSKTNITAAVNVCGMSNEECFFGVASYIPAEEYDMAFAICKNISRVTLKDECFFLIGKQSASLNPDESIKICENISDIYKKSDCRREVAKITAPADIKKALEICEITGDYCYSDVAIALSDLNKTMSKEICDNITNDYAHRRCELALRI